MYKIRKIILSSMLFYVGLLYVLMRPFITVYITAGYKYIFLLLLVGASLISLASWNFKYNFGKVYLMIWFLFYCYVIFNAMFLGDNELLKLAITNNILYTVPIFFMAVLKEKINWNGVLRFLTVFGMIDSAIAIIEFATKRVFFSRFNIRSVEYDFGSYSVIRTYGLNGNYFLLAQILCLCGLAAYYLFTFKKEKLGLIGFLVCTVGVFCTGSRGYYLAYFIGIAFLYFSNNVTKAMDKRAFAKWIALWAVVIILGYLIIGTSITTGNQMIDVILMRIRQMFDWENESSNVVRVGHWQKAVSLWKEHIAFGNGVGVTSSDYSKTLVIPESGVLMRLVEFGIIGTVLQYLTMLYPLVKGLKSLRYSASRDENVFFFFAVIIAFSIEDLVLQCYSNLEFTIIIWTAIAYIYYSRVSSSEESSNFMN